jgi:hypothetical protein
MNSKDLAKVRIELTSGHNLTKDFLALLSDLNPEFHTYFMSLVCKDTEAYYRCLNPKYIDNMLYMKMYRYQKQLWEMLNQCSPPGYYFGLRYSTYSFWPDEETKINNDERKALISQILEIRDQTNNFTGNCWHANIWKYFRDENIEIKLQSTCSEEELLRYLKFLKREVAKCY